jgi:outer membrane protein assembly factor BamE (lipoprotein component of BamABCDE complex)
MKWVFGVIAAGVLAASSSGCLITPPITKMGTPIDTAFVRTIEKGKTTPEEVRTKLGQPSAVTRTSDTEIWTYSHWKGKPAMFGAGYESSTTTTLAITFKDGKVLDYTLSTAGK